MKVCKNGVFVGLKMWMVGKERETLKWREKRKEKDWVFFYIFYVLGYLNWQILWYTHKYECIGTPN